MERWEISSLLYVCLISKSRVRNMHKILRLRFKLLQAKVASTEFSCPRKYHQLSCQCQGTGIIYNIHVLKLLNDSCLCLRSSGSSILQHNNCTLFGYLFGLFLAWLKLFWRLNVRLPYTIIGLVLIVSFYWNIYSIVKLRYQVLII